MRYLIRNSGSKNRAHYWIEGDTACKMWSTGGMNHRRPYRVSDDPDGHPICWLCSMRTDRPGLLIPTPVPPETQIQKSAKSENPHEIKN
jgi:hypothetical protein